MKAERRTILQQLITEVYARQKAVWAERPTRLAERLFQATAETPAWQDVLTNRATQAFRQAAQSVLRSNTAFGAYYRSMRVRKGPEQATVATAHKIPRIVYHLLKYGEA